MIALAAVSSALGPVQQRYLLEARQMQALSFAVHIPLVCFGIAFPMMVLFVEWCYHRSGDELYRTLARRWTRVMVALFAIGVITGTILSFEMGLLWPNFTATFGSVFGLGFAIEGFSFFMEAIFIGIYVYGWTRLSPRTHMLSGIPIVITGLTGSLMVIAVNAWMNHPGGFHISAGKVVDVDPVKALFGNPFLWSELVHMYIAGYIVAGFVVAAAYAFGRLRGRWGRYERTALAIPLTIAALASPVQVLVGDWAARDVARYQPVKLAALEGLARRPAEPPSTSAAGMSRPGQVRDRDPASCSRCSPSMTRTRRCRGSTRCRRPIARRSTSSASRSRPWSGSARCSHCSGCSTWSCAGGAGDLPQARLVLPRRRHRRTAVGGRADRRLGDHRGRTPALGRLRDDAHEAGGHRRRRYTGRLRRRSPRSTWASRSAAAWILRRLAAMPLDRPPPLPATRWRRRSACSTSCRCVFALAGLALYGVLGGADFGAGFWQLTAGGGERGIRIREHAHHSMAPVWEANHVWLIFVLTVTWTAYPKAFGSLASTLCVALLIAAIGIIFRGAAYALRTGGAGREERTIDTVFGISSIVCAVRARGGRRRHRLGPGTRRQRGGRALLQLAEPDLGPDRRARRRHRRLHGRRVPQRRRGPRGDRDLAEIFRARALGAGVVAGRSRSAASS